jgi:glycerol uptake facilitator-like aquaporin
VRSWFTDHPPPDRHPSHPPHEKYLVELIGTFFLVFTIGMTVLAPGAGPLAPLAIGAALMVMIYAGGHISGAHFNPAVTLSVWLRGKCPTCDVAGYMVSQIVGAVVAAFAVLYLKGNPVLPPAGELKVGPALLAEFLGTFALCWVILNTATAKARRAIPTGPASPSASRCWRWPTRSAACRAGPSIRRSRSAPC